MLIEINDHKTIADITDKFTSFFPYLKIAFYQHPHHWYEESKTKDALSPQLTIGEIRNQHPHDNLEIHSWSKTGDIEQAFRKKFHLNVQVFRQQGNIWLQTVDTDQLTLEAQNELGKKASMTNDVAMEARSEGTYLAPIQKM